MKIGEGKIKLLLVEDDEDFRSALVSRIPKRDFDVTAAATAQDALDRIRDNDFDAVVSDINLSQMDGMEFLAKVREFKKGLPVILLTGYGSLESAQETVKLNASDYLLGPLESIGDLLGPIHKAVHKYKLELENRRLEKELVGAGERERQRIGQDLHDGVCQYLTGIGLMTKDLELSLAEKSLPEAETAAKITELLSQAAAEARSLAGRLSPVRLEEDGLVTALGELALDVRRIFEVSCVFKCGDCVFVDHGDVAIHLYRIAQEAINNAVKHGKAKEILVSLDTIRDKTVLMVKDDGKGSAEEDGSTGMGSYILRDRAELINASLDTQEVAGGGTILTCSIEGTQRSKTSGESSRKGQIT